MSVCLFVFPVKYLIITCACNANVIHNSIKVLFECELAVSALLVLSSVHVLVCDIDYNSPLIAHSICLAVINVFVLHIYIFTIRVLYPQ